MKIFALAAALLALGGVLWFLKVSCDVNMVLVPFALAMKIFALAVALLGGVLWVLKASCEHIELAEKMWTYFNACPELLGYRSHLEKKLQILDEKIKALSFHKDDTNTELENSEFRYGRQPKSEVLNWMGNVGRKKTDVESIRVCYGKGNCWFRPMLMRSVLKSIQEVEELLALGEFPNGLLVPRVNDGQPLLSTTLDGQATAKAYVERVWELLTSDEVQSICVEGIKGVGKTNVLLHIHDKVLENKEMFDHVYFVTASQDSSIHKLQNDVAREAGLDLSDEDNEKKREAKLYHVLKKRGRAVILIDDVWKHFDPKDVGIQTSQCKLIVSTQFFDVRRMMGCDRIIKLEPLPEEEAEELFMRTLRSNLLSQEVVGIVKQIIKEGKGVPFCIIEWATRMRGVDDISEWRNMLNELTVSTQSIQHT